MVCTLNWPTFTNSINHKIVNNTTSLPRLYIQGRVDVYDYDRKKVEFSSFENNVVLSLLHTSNNSSPLKLEVQERKLIHRLGTLIPKGINTMNPFGIPIF